MNQWSTKPPGVDDLTGRTINGLKVISFAGRNPQIRWTVKCPKCGTTANELHSALTFGSARCRNTACQLDRLQPVKISAHERWLNAPDEPTPAPQPTPTPQQPVAERPSEEYLRYKRHAVIYDWAQIIDYQHWKALPDRGREFLLNGVERELKGLNK